MPEENANNDDQMVVRWYTRARKFPQLVGKLPDGRKIPFGPYTVTQVVGGGATAVLLDQSVGLWANFGLLGNIAVAFGIVGGVVWGLGRLPMGGRNPIAAGAGVLRAVTSPPVGKLGGRPFHVRRPHQLTHRVVIALEAPALEPTMLAALDDEPEPPEELEPNPTPVRPQTAAMTGVQALLAGKSRPTNVKEI